MSFFSDNFTLEDFDRALDSCSSSTPSPKEFAKVPLYNINISPPTLSNTPTKRFKASSVESLDNRISVLVHKIQQLEDSLRLRDEHLYNIIYFLQYRIKQLEDVSSSTK